MSGNSEVAKYKSTFRHNIGRHHIIRDANNQPISRMTAYLMRGNLLHGQNEERKKDNAESRLLKDMNEHLPNLKKNVRRSDPTYEQVQIKVENLILEIFPEHKWARYIRDMGNPTVSDIKFTPMSLEMYKAIWWILTFPKDQVVEEVSTVSGDAVVQPKDSFNRKVLGRGNGYKSMCKVVTCIRRMHEQAGLIGPTELYEGQQLLAAMNKTYVPDGAPTVDPVILLPAMYESIIHAVKNKKKKCVVLHSKEYITRNWLMFLSMWIMFARPSEIYEFCPAIESISLPGAGVSHDRDGVPPYLLLDLLQWKNRAIAKGRYQIKMVRNRLNAKFCPVFWTLYWLALTGLTSGPLITRLLHNNTEVPASKSLHLTNKGLYVYKSEDGVDVAITQHMLESILTQGFQSAGFSDATPYTIRKTSTVWAARCGAPQYALMATGRWSSSSDNFQRYVQSGLTDADLYENKMDDPIRTLWVYHENVITVLSKPENVTGKKRKSRKAIKQEAAADYIGELTSLSGDMKSLVESFRLQYVETYKTPDLARQAFERNMLFHGVTIAVDSCGLKSNEGPNVVVRPPYDDMAVYKHITKDIVVHAYGLEKLKLEANPQWVKIPTVLTIGLSEKSDNINEIFQGCCRNSLTTDGENEKNEVRLYPDINDFIHLHFSSRQNIINLFHNGDGKFHPAKDWKDYVFSNPRNYDADKFRNYKQHYTYVCEQYIYSMKVAGAYLTKKKDRQQAGRQWVKEHKYSYPRKSLVEIAALIYAECND